MSNKFLNKKTFKALMAYLNPIGSIGGNVDMWGDEVEYFPTVWTSNETFRFKLIDVFQKFLRTLILKFANELFERTDGKDSVYWVDTTINPKKREIVITPKYYTYTESKDNRRFDWRQLRNYYSLSKFMEDIDLEEIIIDYTGYENDFDLTITCNNEELNGQDTRFFKYDVRMMISEVLETDSWNDGAGGHGVMKLYDKDNNGYLYHNWVEKEITSGEPIILKEEDFD